MLETSSPQPDAKESGPSGGFHGRALFVDLTEGRHWIETIPAEVYRDFLGGYGLGAWLMWKHFPAGTDALAPEACFAIVSGLLTGARAPFSGRIQIVGKSPLTETFSDSNSGGTVAIQLRKAGYDALVVRGRAERPSVLVIDGEQVRIEEAGELWGEPIPAAFDALRARYGSKSEVGVSAIGPAGEALSRIACVMNDRYHAFGRSGFGAVYGSKNLKAIVTRGAGKLPIHDEPAFRALCDGITRQYKRQLGWLMRIVVFLTKPKRWLGWLYRLFARLGKKIEAPQAAMRQLWSDFGTTGAVAISIENGDAPVKNWKGVGSRDFPLRTKSMKLDGGEIAKMVTKRLSCGDCPAPCKGIVRSERRGLEDVRRPDYETICGFGASILNDDIDLVTACHDACNRYGIDAVSSSAVLGWVCEAVEVGALLPDALDGIEMRWGAGEAALALTEKMGKAEGCGAWLGQGVQRAAAHLGKGTEAFAVHVHGSEPAYHDPRFTSLMGVTYIADPSPGRHTAGSASWNETFGMPFPIPGAADPKEVNVAWKGSAGKGVAQAHFSNAHQVLNGLGLCMFTTLTGGLPLVELTNALTGWGLTPEALLRCGERIQNLRAAFNWREGLRPADFAPHPRMMGQGDGLLPVGPLAGIEVPLLALRADYFRAMHWDAETGHLSQARAEALGMSALLAEHLPR
ncbi:MAG: hypothetical protein OEY14_00775 [Myxococcales bacterium]|nr:hypothetical protein [Myxococcales bacterium]